MIGPDWDVWIKSFARAGQVVTVVTAFVFAGVIIAKVVARLCRCRQ